jgi:hypothetical protein
MSKRDENRKKSNHKLSQRSPKGDPVVSGRRIFWTAPFDGAVWTVDRIQTVSSNIIELGRAEKKDEKFKPERK